MILIPDHSGYATISGPKRTVEIDTATCCHCNRVWFVRSSDGKQDLGGWCRQCSAMICSPCVGKDCIPFKKKLDLYESKQKLFRELGLEL